MTDNQRPNERIVGWDDTTRQKAPSCCPTWGAGPPESSPPTLWGPAPKPHKRNKALRSSRISGGAWLLIKQPAWALSEGLSALCWVHLKAETPGCSADVASWGFSLPEYAVASLCWVSILYIVSLRIQMCVCSYFPYPNKEAAQPLSQHDVYGPSSS